MPVHPLIPDARPSVRPEAAPWPRRALAIGLALATVALVAACGGGSGGGGGGEGTGQASGLESEGVRAASASSLVAERPPQPEAWDDPGNGIAVPAAMDTTPASPVLTGLSSRMYNASVVLDDAGNGLVVWAETPDTLSTAALRAIRYQAGSGWSAPETLDAEAPNINGAALAIDPISGRAVASWIGREAGGRTVGRVSTYDPATGTWTALPEPGIASILGAAQNLRSVIGPDGQVSSVWLQENDADHPGLRRLYASDYHPGGGYTVASRVDRFTPAEDYSNAMDLQRLADGRLALAWSDAHPTAADVQSVVELKAAIRPVAGGTWQVTSIAREERAVARLSGVQVGATMLFSPQGHGLFTYTLTEVGSGRSSIVMHRYINEWRPRQVLAESDAGIPGEVFGVPRVGLNRAGSAVIGWYSSATDKLRRLYGVRGQNAFGPIPSAMNAAQLLDTGSTESDRDHLRVSLDDWGRAAITWSDTLGTSSADRRTEVMSMSHAPGEAWDTPVRLDSEQPMRPLSSLFSGSNRFGDRIVVWTQNEPGADGQVMAARVDRTPR